MNNGYDIEQTWKELGNDENITSLATSIATAGLIAYADVQLFEEIRKNHVLI